MKTLLAASALILLVAAPAAASDRKSCGAGYVTALGVNASKSDENVGGDNNIYFSLDNSLESPELSKFATVDDKKMILMRYDDNNPASYEAAVRTVQTAFLAGAPVRVMAWGDTCATTYWYMNVTMCTASSAPGTCKRPR